MTSVLGKSVAYPTAVDPAILEFIDRKRSRSNLKVMPVDGEDIWTSYEFSWLDFRGSPEEAILKMRIGWDSESIVESKSFKLFLSGFAFSRFSDKQKVIDAVSAPLQKGLRARSFSVELLSVEDEKALPAPVRGYCIDIHTLKEPKFEVDPSLLRCGTEIRNEVLYSNSFRSLCPVTGQPDWATIMVLYNGPEILPEDLRAYLCSYRTHQGFHESCCEHIYSDIMARCAPSELSVACAFTRRGGIDITPVRNSARGVAIKLRRTVRQ